LEELSQHLTYNDLVGDGSSQFVNLDDYLPAEALREALTDGLKDHTEQQMKAAIARLQKTYDEWERMRKGKEPVQEIQNAPRGSEEHPLRRQSRLSYRESIPPLVDSAASQPVVKKRKHGVVLDQLEHAGQGFKRFVRKVSGGRKGL
jgi:hypothetical protein